MNGKLIIGVLVAAIATIVIGLQVISHSEDVSHVSSGIPPDISEEPPEQFTEFIEAAFYRRVSEHDSGTLQVYIRNITDETFVLRKVLLDGLPISVWGVEAATNAVQKKTADENNNSHESVYLQAAARIPHRRIIWARLAPAHIPPRGVGELAAKLASPMPRPMRIELVPIHGDTISTVIRLVKPAIEISAITFSQDLRSAYIYIESAADVPLEIESARIDGTLRRPQIRLLSQTIQPRDKQLAIATFTQPLAQGQFVTVQVKTTDGNVAQERVRVFNSFPISVEHGSPQARSDHAFEREPIPALPAQHVHGGTHVINHIYDCAIHTFRGNHTRSATEIMRRYYIFASSEPELPCSQHLCRVRPEAAYALFGELTDILRVNPNINSGDCCGPCEHSPEENVARMTRLARISNRPRPIHALIHTTPFAETQGICEPEELIRRAHIVIGEGSKAAIYRHAHSDSADEKGKAINQSIADFNTKLRHVRDYLAIADVVDWLGELPDNLLGYSLLAGDKALIIILVNKPTGGVQEEVLQIPVRLDHFAPGRLMHVRNDGLHSLTNIERGNHELETILQLPFPAITEIYLLELNGLN